jgi:predicted metalloprotease
MRLGDYRTSDNVSDQGRGFGGGGFGGGGGGCLTMLIPLVLSRFGIGGVLILLLGYCALSSLGGGGGLGLGGPDTAVTPQQSTSATNDARQACSSDPAKRFACQVLANTEDTWAQIFAAQGRRYQPTPLSFYGGGGNSGCGIAQSAMGPFYCPTDKTIYLDTAFFDELQTRFGAAGDFAQAYVVAHEVGHHIQDLTGVLDDASARQQSLSSREGNAVQVRVELQADCYAGVWAAHAKDSQGRPAMEPGDVEEGLRAAQAIGDATLQRQAQGRVVPEAFTHGSSAQRVQWLRKGLESGDPAACDTFSGAV